MAVSVEALVFIVIGHSCSNGCGFDSYYRPGSFLRFNSLPIISSPYCATWNKGVQLLSVLKLWSIVETSVMSENDCITVRQTVEHTIHLWPHGMPCGFMPFEEKCIIISSVSKPSCSSSGAGPYDTTTTGPRWGVYNTRRGLNKYTSYITLHLLLVDLYITSSVISSSAYHNLSIHVSVISWSVYHNLSIHVSVISWSVCHNLCYKLTCVSQPLL